MCGIIGLFNIENASELAVKGLEIIKNRGKDAYGISDYNSIIINKKLNNLKINKHQNILAHCLHSIVGYLPQPIKNNGLLTANCEIYNWQDLNKKFDLKAKNDSDLLIKLLEKNDIKNLKKTLGLLDGVYAFAYWYNDEVYVARDILGIKPLWYSTTKGFSFASEKKVLEDYGFIAEELNPRKIIIYNIKKNKIKKINRNFFTSKPEINEPLPVIKNKLKKIFLEAIKKRIPSKKFGILFSGGIDSTIIALICKKFKLNFTCYTAAVKGIGQAEDIVYAKKIAKKYNLKLKIKEIPLSEVKNYIKKVVPLIEDSNVVKVGIGLPFYVACQEAKKDNVKVIFSGLGSEEIFAGYERHKHSLDVNKECVYGLMKLYERDTYRDDVITMNKNLELRLPFLDNELVTYALKIPSSYKLKNEKNKIILRQIAHELGLSMQFSQRKKRAAQYGSNFDKAIQKLAILNGFKLKSEYLNTFYNKPNLKLGVLFSSGKDSSYALHIMKRQNYEISCLINIKSKNPDSYMFHTPNTNLVNVQAEAMQIPLIQETTLGEKEKELKDLERAIKKAIKKFGIQGIVTGALFSTYQRDRIEKICDKLGLKIFNPLWHMDQEKEITHIVNNGFEVILSSISALGLNKSWLGKIITNQEIDKLKVLNKKYKLNVSFEGGEAESLVLDAPFFKKKIVIEKSKIIEENQNTAKLLIEKVNLIKK